MATGFGAAIVIVGAMFKIMHWPGASVMLVAGLSTEAALFVMGAFEKPHMDVDWSLVYPELAGGQAKSKTAIKDNFEARNDATEFELKENSFSTYPNPSKGYLKTTLFRSTVLLLAVCFISVVSSGALSFIRKPLLLLKVVSILPSEFNFLSTILKSFASSLNIFRFTVSPDTVHHTRRLQCSPTSDYALTVTPLSPTAPGPPADRPRNRA